MAFDRRAFLVGAALLSASSFAASSFAAPGDASAQGSGDAAAVVKNLQRSMLDVIRNAAHISLRKRYDALRPAIGATFDLPAMAKTAFGPGWDAMTEAQRQDWTKSFGDYIAASYAARLDSLNVKDFDPDAKSIPQGDDVIVTSRMILTDGPPAPINYVMRRTPQGWRIGDILANGSVSELAQWRRSLHGYKADVLRQRKDAFLTP